MKNLRKVEMSHFNSKCIYTNPVTGFTLNTQRPNAFYPKPGSRQECLFNSSCLLYILASEIRQRGKEGRQLGKNTDWKGRKAMSLFTDDITKYILHT